MEQYEKQGNRNQTGTANRDIFQPVATREYPPRGWRQDLYRFPNGYGMSVAGIGDNRVAGLIRWTGNDDDDFVLDGSTPLTDDSDLGRVTPEGHSLLEQIAALPAVGGGQ